MGSGEESNQRINRRLGGIGSQIYRTRNGRLRVGIRNPSVKRRNSRIDADADENQPERRSVHISGQIGQTDSVMENLYQNSGQQHVSSEGMHQNVSERRPGRTPAVPGVYDVRGCEGRNLPEYNEADQIPGEYDAHITPRRRRLPDTRKKPEISASMSHFFSTLIRASSAFTSAENDIYFLSPFAIKSRSRWVTVVRYPFSLKIRPNSLATATDRWCPPVQPTATFR